EQRVIFATATQHLNRAPQFLFAPDERLDVSGLCLLVQVDGELGERILTGIIRAFFFVALDVSALELIARTVFAHAMGDEIDDVVTSDAGIFQCAYRWRIDFRENGDEYVVALELIFATL